MGIIYKQALYDFLEIKEKEVLAEKIEPLTSKIDELKESLYKQKLAEYGVKLDNLHESARVAKNLLDPVAEMIGYMPWSLKDYTRTLENLTVEGFRSETLETINNGDLDKLKQERSRLRNDIKVEFAKIKAVVKKKPNGIKGYEYLKELGFDVSSVEIVDEYQLEVVNVDKNLLGLNTKGV